MKTKICSKCKKEFPATPKYFYSKKYSWVNKDGTKKYGIGLSSICIIDDNKISKIYRNNPNYIRVKSEKTKKKDIKRATNWIINNRNKFNNRNRKRAAKIINNLEDEYIKNKLARATKCKFKDIPSNIISVKRQQLLLHREIKKLES